LDGIIIINKPKGMTSHDVVAEVRRITGERSCGHTGTLDPDATGVLVVCMGRATRLSRFMMETPKEYEAAIVFGISTDTGDASGKVVAVSEDVKVPRKRVFEAFQRFVGDIEQIPPMVSAVRHRGRRLYELAREGITVEREPRRVTIYEIEPASLEDWPEVVRLGSQGSMRVVCSKGTYIRTLCEDICASIGIEGHMGSDQDGLCVHNGLQQFFWSAHLGMSPLSSSFRPLWTSSINLSMRAPLSMDSSYSKVISGVKRNGTRRPISDLM
jgi:tRNA pseudouridine55 synthase